MRGHIRKRGDRSWAVVVDIGRDPSTGRRRQKWVSVKGTKRMAERKLAEVIRDLDTGAFVEPSRLTLADYLDIWLRDYVSTSVRPRTQEGYASIVRRIKPHLGNIQISGLKPQHIQRYYADLLAEGLATQTVIHNHRLLRQALGQAVRWDMLTVNVMDRVTPPHLVKPELRILDEPEIHRLLDAAERPAIRRREIAVPWGHILCGPLRHPLPLTRHGFQTKTLSHFRTAGGIVDWIEPEYDVRYKGKCTCSVLVRLACSPKVPRNRREKADVREQGSWEMADLGIRLKQRCLSGAERIFGDCALSRTNRTRFSGCRPDTDGDA